MAALRGCDSPLIIAVHAGALRARGIDFIMRRYSRDPARNLDAAEAERLSDAGFRIGALWDGQLAPDALSRRQGLLDGAEALRLARAAGQPSGSAIYFAVGECAPADLDGSLGRYLAGLRAALGGGAGYRIGVRGSHAACAGLVDRGLAALSWLALTAPDTLAARHALLQWPAARLVLDGCELRLAPVLGQPGRDPGLFRVASGAHGDARRAGLHAANHGRL